MCRNNNHPTHPRRRTYMMLLTLSATAWEALSYILRMYSLTQSSASHVTRRLMRLLPCISSTAYTRKCAILFLLYLSNHACKNLRTACLLKASRDNNQGNLFALSISGFIQPNHQLGHLEKCLFSLSKKIFFGSKYPRNILINFETRSSHEYVSL